MEKLNINQWAEEDRPREKMAVLGADHLTNSKMTIRELCDYKGIGEAKAISILAACELGKRRQAGSAEERPDLGTATLIYNHMRPKLQDLDVEEFWVLLLNQHYRLIKKVRISHGGITETSVDIRIVMKEAVLANCTILAVCHNHPSGNLSPSKADDELTRSLKRACELIRNLSETEVTKIDPVAMGSFPQEWLAEKNVFWLLQNDDCSDVFYRHYHARYFHESYVYIIYCNSSDNFYSNCALLQLYLTIQRGIDLEDIAGKTPAYKDMINSVYLYHEALSFMTTTDLSEE